MIFVLLKLTCLLTLFDNTGLKKKLEAKLTIFCHFFKELLSTQNLNVENVRLFGAFFKHCGI